MLRAQRNWQMLIRRRLNISQADMAELADAIDLGSIINRCAGSSPVIRIAKALCLQRFYCAAGSRTSLVFLDGNANFRELK